MVLAAKARPQRGPSRKAPHKNHCDHTGEENCRRSRDEPRGNGPFLALSRAATWARDPQGFSA